MTQVADLLDPREKASELVEAVHAGNVLSVHRVLRSLDGEGLRTVAQYLAACIDPDDVLAPRRGRRNVETVLELAVTRSARVFDVPVAEVRGRTRKTAAVNARQVAVWVVVNLGYSQNDVARAIGRDHSSIHGARRRVENSELLLAAASRVRRQVSDEVFG